MSSDWPVCSVSETAAPHRMGAALTYARRYALFTLVGIAGEDDLDAPDLNDCGPGVARDVESWRQRSPAPSRESGNGRLRGARNSNAAAVLDAAQSTTLRDKLLAEVASVTSPELAAAWATQALPAKNSLIASDAKLLEDAFEQKLSSLSSCPVGEASAGEEPQASGAESDQPRGVDKSVLAIAAPRRYRNREHLRH